MTANWPAQLGKLATVTTSGAVTLGKHSSWNATSGALTATLPALSSTAVAAALTAGQVVRAKISKSKSDVSGNSLTVACSGSDTFEGGTTSQTLLSPGEKLTVYAGTVPGASGPTWIVEEHTTPRDTLDKRYIVPNPTDIGYDIVLLIGQSNMEGVTGGTVSAALDVVDSRIYSYAATGTYAAQLAQAFDPLGHPGTVQATVVVGPGMTFARWYSGIVPGNRRVLLVPAAYGGTGFGTSTQRWDPTTAWPNDSNNLYNQAIAQVQAALAAAGANSRIVAALWIQGETDAGASMSASTYRTYFEQLIDGLRSRLSLPNLPFVIGSMTPEFLGTTGAAATAIDGVHQATPTRKAFTSYVAGPAGMGRGDNLHYNNAGAREMGRLMVAGYASAVANTSPASTVAPNPPTPPSTVLTNSSAPTISGTTTQGQTLTASTGTWSATPDSYTYQWNRAGTAISGATASTYVPVAGDVGSTLTVTVTAVKAGYTSGSATSAATAAIAASGSPSLTNSVGPAISGTATVGSVLTTTNGTWSATPDSYTYQP